MPPWAFMNNRYKGLKRVESRTSMHYQCISSKALFIVPRDLNCFLCMLPTHQNKVLPTIFEVKEARQRIHLHRRYQSQEPNLISPTQPLDTV